MLTNFRISHRLTAGLLLLLALTVGIMLPSTLYEITKMTTFSETRHLASLYQTFIKQIQSTANDGLLALEAIVAAPGVGEALAAQDRARLQMLTTPVFQRIHTNANIQQFQFHLPPATSFLRVHMPQKFGDDLSSARPTVVKANATGQSQIGLESGDADLELRAVAPVMSNGRQVGSAELGLSFGQDYFDRFTNNYKAQAALHLMQDGQFKIFASTIADGSVVDAQELGRALQGEQIVRTVERNGVSWAMMARPIADFSGAAIGVVEMLVDLSEYEAARMSMMMQMLAIGIGAALTGLLLAWLLSRSIVAPLIRLTAATESISRGKLEHEIEDTDRKDEIGALARGVARMAKSIQISMDRLKSR